MNGVLLAKPWTSKIDPKNWWMSEKLDGVRAIWLPDEDRFVSRNGKEFFAPKWFRRFMPQIPLDGELFIGRGKFDQTVSVVRAHDDRGWDKVCYRVFDLYPVDETIRADLALDLFEVRQVTLRDRINLAHHACGSRSLAALQAVKQKECASTFALVEFADKIHAKGGEGVMLRAPGSLYEKKRSSTLLKVKRFEDCEATVVGVVPGKGKHEGRMGALDCWYPRGHHPEGAPIHFQVGTGFNDSERSERWKKGTKITVRYQELTKDGVPRFPVYVARRDYE